MSLPSAPTTKHKAMTAPTAATMKNYGRKPIALAPNGDRILGGNNRGFKAGKLPGGKR